jgi:serine/threonine protein kinase/predicted ATPase
MSTHGDDLTSDHGPSGEPVLGPARSAARPSDLPSDLEGGRYRFVRLLGGGGFGNVWLGLDMKWSPGREVAIKRLRAELVRHPDWRAMHSDALAGRLRSPHVAQIYDIVKDGEGLALVMEYVAGMTLRERIVQSGRLTIDETMRVGRAVAHALDEAHSKRIIHRDIKPANIMIADDVGSPGGGRQIDEKAVKVVDWGLALGVPQWNRSLDDLPVGDEDTRWMPADGQLRFAGTAEYMAPEQFEGHVDRQADVWAYGCLLYECLAGERAFHGRGPDLLRKIAEASVDLSALPPSTPQRLRTLIELCLQPEPRRRLPHIGSVFAFLGDDTSSRPVRAEVRSPKDLLPSQPPSAVQRAELVASAVQAVRESTLVALSGPSGCGKSWIAARVGRTLLDPASGQRLGAGAARVDLVGVDDVKTAIARVAAVLREIDGDRTDAVDGESLRQRILRVAADGLLLVLDNADGVMRELPDLLRGALVPGLRVLATARRSPAHPAWAVVRVPPLSSPGDARWQEGVVSAAALRGFESVQLFTMRAKAARRSFELTNENAAAVAETCRRLGGLPRAIELVASRLGFLAPDEVVARLPQLVRPLVADSALPAGDTLARTVQWSIDSTTPDERLLLERLSVFEGSWTLASVEDVCCDERLPAAALHELLNGLVDLGLVQEESGVTRPRFRVLEFVRDQCRQRLATPERSEEAAALRGRHLARFRELASEAPPVNDWGHRVPRSAQRLELEHELDDCRAAIEWGIASPAQLETAADLAVDMQDHWYQRGRYRQGIDLVQSVLGAWGDRGDVRQVRLLAARAKLLWARDARAAHDGYLRALALQRSRVTSSGDRGATIERLRLARLLQNVGLTAQQTDALAESRPALEEALAIYRDLRDQVGVAQARFAIGLLDLFEGKLPEARVEFDSALPTVRESGDSVLLGAIYQYKGRLELVGGRLSEAIRWCRDALAMRRAAYEPAGVADSLRLAGEIAAARGLPRVAVRLFAAAQRRRDALGVDIPPREVERYEEAFEAARATMSAGAFEAAWHDGVLLSDDEASAIVGAAELDGAPVQ